MRLLERLFDQNEQALGTFFLYPDADAGIAEPAVAFLRVSIALRTEHYEVLRGARVGALRPDFRAKLGWLTGNLYARPAAPDWSERPNGKKQREELVERCLKEVKWVDDGVVAAAQQQHIDLATASPDVVTALRPPSSVERAVSEVQAELERISPGCSSETVTKLCNRLRNSAKFTKLFR
jgi:hypothetical protein